MGKEREVGRPGKKALRRRHRSLQGSPGRGPPPETGESFVVPNQEEGFEELLGSFEEARPALVLLEASGGFERPVAAALAAAGLAVCVINPTRTRDFARATAASSPRPIGSTPRSSSPASPRLCAAPPPEEDPPGGAARTGRPPSRAALRPGRSGSSEAGLRRHLVEGPRRSVWGGRGRVREALYMGAPIASRRDPKIREFYGRLLAAGKPKKVALVACMSKLLVTLNAILRDRTPWRYPHALNS